MDSADGIFKVAKVSEFSFKNDESCIRNDGFFVKHDVKNDVKIGKGATQVILEMCGNADEIRNEVSF